MKLYNTLTNKKQEFAPQETGKVKMYSCGPTVYDYAHIGNLAAFIYADNLRRFLEYKGFEVRQIMNITDVGHLTEDDLGQADSGEDKMSKAAKREKKSPQDIADFYAKHFFDDVEKLNVKKSAYYPKATAHISQMIKIIETLIKKDLAYEKNGNVFYDVERFKGYGKLSGKKLDELKHGARLEDHPDKKHPWDFALWLRAPKEHILKWESPWSVGYPGWHIECSAMSMEYLGQTLDIHTGGEDHIFPHHENEIAQSEGATEKPFSLFWVHNRFLLVDGQKMSKSKGNFYTLKDILDKGYDPMAFRLLVLGSHYRSNLNFTWKALDQARTNLEKIQRFVEKIDEFAPASTKTAAKTEGLSKDYTDYLQRFESAMSDDLNTPLALSVLYEMITEVNKKMAEGEIWKPQIEKVKSVWEKMNSVFGLKFDMLRDPLPEEIKQLAISRKTARKNKQFHKADKIRDQIEEAGYSVEDTPEEQIIRKK